tara:strand:+ start:357 stop:635 length:279 start_codon:yes stop_codon:yes gene_type:complete
LISVLGYFTSNILGSNAVYITPLIVADLISKTFPEYPSDGLYLFVTTIGNFSGLFSVGGTTEDTPSTKDNSYIISDRIIGCPICQFFISKKS